MSKHNWVDDVLSDLKSYCRTNGLFDVADHILDAQIALHLDSLPGEHRSQHELVVRWSDTPSTTKPLKRPRTC